MKITRVLQSTILAATIAGALLMTPTAVNARVFVSVGFAPPAIPVYVQPVAPAYGYIWTPGYWDYAGGFYVWSPGYWGRRVGYYGGVNYGFGYFGVGFWGGYWNGGHFFYNREYNHLGFRDHEGFVYSHHVEGFDGRPGGAAFNRGGAASFNRTAIAQNRGSGINGNVVARSNGYASRGGYNAPARNYGGGEAAARGNYGGGAHTAGSGGAHFSGGGGSRGGGGGGRR